MVNGKNKGNTHERLVASQLSLWWTDGRQDDIFFRSASSGGRATQRAKKGQTTANAAGDLAAMTKEGQEFLDFITVEIKRGYNTISVADLYEKVSGGFWDFIDQAKKAASIAGTPYWMVIHKRDRRDAVIVMPAAALGLVSDFGEESPEDALIAHNYDLFLTDPSLKTLLKSAIENGRR
jgi:hypothetical protein